MTWRTSGIGGLGDPTDLDELEPERLDALEHAMQRGLVGDLAREHCLGRRGRRGQVVEGGRERLAQPAANADLITGAVHGDQVLGDPYEPTSHDAYEGVGAERAGADGG